MKKLTSLERERQQCERINLRPLEEQGPKYPDIKVRLTGQDGNAFIVLGLVMRAIRRAGLPDETITEFNEEACSGDYNHLLQTCMRWVDVS